MVTRWFTAAAAAAAGSGPGYVMNEPAGVTHAYPPIHIGDDLSPVSVQLARRAVSRGHVTQGRCAPHAVRGLRCRSSAVRRLNATQSVWSGLPMLQLSNTPRIVGFVVVV